MQVAIVSTSQVEITYAAGTSANQKPPLIAIELAAEGNKIVCKTELSTVVPRFLAIFDKAITITQVSHSCEYVSSSTHADYELALSTVKIP